MARPQQGAIFSTLLPYKPNNTESSVTCSCSSIITCLISYSRASNSYLKLSLLCIVRNLFIIICVLFDCCILKLGYFSTLFEKRTPLYTLFFIILLMIIFRRIKIFKNKQISSSKLHIKKTLKNRGCMARFLICGDIFRKKNLFITIKNFFTLKMQKMPHLGDNFYNTLRYLFCHTLYIFIIYDLIVFPIKKNCFLCYL